jgi:hypothetical protein
MSLVRLSVEFQAAAYNFWSMLFHSDSKKRAKPVWRIEFYNFTILVWTIWLIDYKGGKVQLKNIFNSINATAWSFQLSRLNCHCIKTAKNCGMEQIYFWQKLFIKLMIIENSQWGEISSQIVSPGGTMGPRYILQLLISEKSRNSQ